ncbi:MAG: hypothetical protein ACRD3J_24545 [Thermoanaerobaculia bacterium]
MVKSNKGQPEPQSDSWAKITVVLLDRHVAYLDRIAVDIRLSHSFAISRAELIRSLIEAASQTNVVLSDASDGKQMIEMLRDAWSGGRPKKRR